LRAEQGKDPPGAQQVGDVLDQGWGATAVIGLARAIASFRDSAKRYNGPVPERC
jgi:hypothetical protein